MIDASWRLGALGDPLVHAAETPVGSGTTLLVACRNSMHGLAAGGRKRVQVHGEASRCAMLLREILRQ